MRPRSHILTLPNLLLMWVGLYVADSALHTLRGPDLLFAKYAPPELLSTGSVAEVAAGAVHSLGMMGPVGYIVYQILKPNPGDADAD